MCRDSSVGLVTHYGLEVPGIESQWSLSRYRKPSDVRLCGPSLGFHVRVPLSAWLFLLCVLNSNKKQSRTNKDKKDHKGRNKNNPVDARFSTPVQTGPGARPASYIMGKEVWA